MRNKNNETPLDAARARILHEIWYRAEHGDSGKGSGVDTDGFDLEVQKHYAKIHNQLADRWGFDPIHFEVLNVRSLPDFVSGKWRAG
tara:strand:+ start:655 stop:915 length:261 start_codon:yes stop_codon:yes gene_type:complete